MVESNFSLGTSGSIIQNPVAADGDITFLDTNQEASSFSKSLGSEASKIAKRISVIAVAR